MSGTTSGKNSARNLSEILNSEGPRDPAEADLISRAVKEDPGSLTYALTTLCNSSDNPEMQKLAAILRGVVEHLEQLRGGRLD